MAEPTGLKDLRGRSVREVHRNDSVIITGAEYLRKSRLALQSEHGPAFDTPPGRLLRGLLQRGDLRRGVLADVEVALAGVEELRRERDEAREQAAEAWEWVEQACAAGGWATVFDIPRPS